MNKISRKIHKRRKCATTCKKYRASSNRKRRTRRYRKRGSGLVRSIVKHGLSGLTTTSRLATNLASTTLKTAIRNGTLTKFTSEFETFKNERICVGNEKIYCTKRNKYGVDINLLNNILSSNLKKGSNRITIINERNKKKTMNPDSLSESGRKTKNFEVFNETLHKLPIGPDVTTETKLFTLTYPKQSINSNPSKQTYITSNLFFFYVWFYEKTNLSTTTFDVIGNYVDTYVSMFVFHAERSPEALYIAYNLTILKQQTIIDKLSTEITNLEDKINKSNNEIAESTKNHEKQLKDINEEYNRKNEEYNKKQTELNGVKDKLNQIAKENPTFNISIDTNYLEKRFNELTNDIFYYVPGDDKYKIKNDYELYVDLEIPIYKNNQFVIIRLYHDIQLGGTTNAQSNNLFYDYTVATKKNTYTSEKNTYTSENDKKRLLTLTQISRESKMLTLFGLKPSDYNGITDVVNKIEISKLKESNIPGFNNNNNTSEDYAYNYELVLHNSSKYKLDISSEKINTMII
jgi:hypothetical protein